MHAWDLGSEQLCAKELPADAPDLDGAQLLEEAENRDSAPLLVDAANLGGAERHVQGLPTDAQELQSARLFEDAEISAVHSCLRDIAGTELLEEAEDLGGARLLQDAGDLSGAELQRMLRRKLPTTAGGSLG